MDYYLLRLWQTMFAPSNGFISTVLWFGVFYLLVWGGFKILKIKGVPRHKIIVFLFGFYLILTFVVPHLFGFVGQNGTLYSIVFSAVILIPLTLAFKFYWKLQNIDVLKLLGWFVALYMILYAIPSLLVYG